MLTLDTPLLHRAATGILSMLLVPACLGAAERANYRTEQPDVSEDVEQVLWWFPAETEAVLVTRGSVRFGRTPLVTRSGTNKAPRASVDLRESRERHWELEDLVASRCVEPLIGGYCYPDDERQTLLDAFFGPKTTAYLFVKAVWWEADETRQVCSVVLFRDDAAARLVDALSQFRHRQVSIRGLRVLVVDLNWGRSAEKPQRFSLDLDDVPSVPKRRFIASPSPNAYIVTTSPGLMEQMLSRMSHRPDRRALPPHLPEWRYVDVTAATWGLRHYRAETADKDCLSMLEWDPRAQGLVFWGDSDPSPAIVLRYVSPSQNAHLKFRAMQTDWFHARDPSKLPVMRRIADNCVEARTQINVPQESMSEKPWTTLSVQTTRVCLDIAYLPWLGFSCPRIAFRSQ